MWVRVNVSAVRDDNGRFLRATNIIEDITERQQAEMALRESQRQLQAINETLEQRVARADGRGGAAGRAAAGVGRAS